MFKCFENNLLLNKLNSNKIFEEIICFITMLITFITWYYNSYFGLACIFLLLIILLVIFNDFKYMMPIAFAIIYSQRSGFTVTDTPVYSIIGGVLAALVFLLFVIKNKLKLSNLKSIIPLSWLSISCILPIFWNNNVGNNQFGLYFLYFAYILYTIIYIVFAGSLKSNSFRMLCYTMSWVGVLLTLECGVAVLNQYQEYGYILHNFDLGWGICNEAGIMLCVSIPFVFIRLIKSNKIIKVLYNIILIFVLILGMVLTNSRGTYLFGFFELAFLIIISLFYSKKRITVLLSYIGLSLVALLFLHLKYGITEVLNIVTQEVYSFTIDFNGDGIINYDDILSKAFDDNGRKELWVSSINIWNQSSLNKIWGVGLIPEYYAGNLGRLIVYHSTLYETLACFGLVGLVGLCYHLIQKYFHCLKFEKGIFLIMVIGYGFVDMYGMLDNTYHMYYYMIPLMVIMASVDSYDGKELEL